MKIKDTDKINVATLNGYMKRISRFYNFCFASQYTTINPCLFVTKDKSQISEREEREAFTKDDISKLIPIIKEYDIYKQVIYFSLIFTGLRISELYKVKIKQHNENEFYFDLTDSNIKLKTKNSHRIIPLHKELIKMDVQTLLPKALELNKMNWIRRLFNEKIKVKITSSKKKVLYSFRHTVASELKYLNVKSEIISEILGHTNSNITLDRYASRYTFEVLKNEIDKIEFSL
jgi:integrase